MKNYIQETKKYVAGLAAVGAVTGAASADTPDLLTRIADGNAPLLTNGSAPIEQYTGSEDAGLMTRNGDTHFTHLQNGIITIENQLIGYLGSNFDLVGMNVVGDSTAGTATRYNGQTNTLGSVVNGVSLAPGTTGLYNGNFTNLNNEAVEFFASVAANDNMQYFESVDGGAFVLTNYTIPGNLGGMWDSSVDLYATGMDTANDRTDLTFTIQGDGGNGQEYAATTTEPISIDSDSFQIVPEPSSLALVGLGGLLTGLRRKRIDNNAFYKK